MREILIRFLIGGLAVTLFAALGDILKPKSFAGIFGAAPSLALATLALTILQKPAWYAAVEGRSMLLGACGLLVYCVTVGCMLRKKRLRALTASLISLPVWFGLSFTLWFVVAR